MTGADPLPYASRVRKARRSATVACGHFVLQGQVIAYCGNHWYCLGCALAGIGAISRQETS